MKQLLTILFLALAIASKAQSQDTIKIPVPAARQIAKDLAICDSIKAVHELTKEQLVLTEDKVVLKDSIISSFKDKCATYDTMLANEKQKFEVQGAWVQDLRKENRKLKVKVLYTKISMSAIIGFLGYLLIK
jgi:hypothetical protein